MDDNPDLRHLLDEPTPPPATDELQAIVRKAGRRGARMAAAAGVVVLAAGGLGGYLISNHSDSNKAVVATGATAPASSSGGNPTSAPAIAPVPGSESGAASSEPGIAGDGPFTHVLTRATSSGVTVRIFDMPATTTTAPTPATPATPGKTPAASAADIPVSPGVSRLIEVSTADMVGSVETAQGEATTASPDLEVVGTAEGAPVIVVSAFTPATVTEVKWTGEGAGDAMAPKSDFVALAVPVATAPAVGAALGTLTFTDSAGHVIQTDHLTLGVLGPKCFSQTTIEGSGSSTGVWCGGVTCASSSGSGVSGSSGSGSSGSSGPGSSGPGATASPALCRPIPARVHCTANGDTEICSAPSNGSSVVPPGLPTPKPATVKPASAGAPATASAG